MAEESQPLLNKKCPEEKNWDYVQNTRSLSALCAIPLFGAMSITLAVGSLFYERANPSFRLTPVLDICILFLAVPMGSFALAHSARLVASQVRESSCWKGLAACWNGRRDGCTRTPESQEERPNADDIMSRKNL